MKFIEIYCIYLAIGVGVLSYFLVSWPLLSKLQGGDKDKFKPRGFADVLTLILAVFVCAHLWPIGLIDQYYVVRFWQDSEK